MRKIPIVTFINKMDRDGKDPLDLMDEIEQVLGIPCCPINWPIGAGSRFQGVFDREKRELMRFVESDFGARKARREIVALDDPTFIETVGETPRQLESSSCSTGRQCFDLILSCGDHAGVLGSAMNNFGVELPDGYRLRPPSRPALGPRRGRPADFTFVFRSRRTWTEHRDRIAFTHRSGRFERGMSVKHVRTGRTLVLNRSLQFLRKSAPRSRRLSRGTSSGSGTGVLRIGDT
jgi:peptide chain release factor 3